MSHRSARQQAIAEQKRHKKMLEEHQDRMQHVKSKVPHHAPKLHAGNFLRIQRLKDDASVYLETMRKNIHLLVSLNAMLRTQGVINSFPPPTPGTTFRVSRMLEQTRVRHIELENMKLARRIFCAKSMLKTQPPPELRLRRPSELIIHEFVYPEKLMEKYNGEVKIPSQIDMQKRLFRPKIYWDIEVKEIRRLGRVVIELFTEAAPQIVLEFVRMCIVNDKKRIRFPRLFTDLWLEGEIYFGDDAFKTDKFEYDLRAIDHGTNFGVLSVTQDAAKHLLRGYLNFSVSFKRLVVCNNRRVAFGIVRRGFKTIECLQDYGTKNGKPSKEIFLCKCGITSEMLPPPVRIPTPPIHSFLFDTSEDESSKRPKLIAADQIRSPPSKDSVSVESSEDKPSKVERGFMIDDAPPTVLNRPIKTETAPEDRHHGVSTLSSEITIQLAQPPRSDFMAKLQKQGAENLNIIAELKAGIEKANVY